MKFKQLQKVILILSNSYYIFFVDKMHSYLIKRRNNDQDKNNQPKYFLISA